MSGKTLLLQCALVLSTALALDEEERRKERLAAKPWYMRDTSIFGITIPVSPVTLVIATVAMVNLVRAWRNADSWAQASHILIQDHSQETKTKLQDFKTKIKNDAVQFANCARQYSSCPSKAQGGNLGKFKKGDMAPPFDRAVFDPESPLEQTIGPIETSFGWHLIYIHKRHLNA